MPFDWRASVLNHTKIVLESTCVKSYQYLTRLKKGQDFRTKKRSYRKIKLNYSHDSSSISVDRSFLIKRMLVSWQTASAQCCRVSSTIVWTKPRGLSCSVTWTRAIGVSVKMMTFPLLCASIVKPFKGNIPVITLEKQGCQRLREKMHITKVLYSNYAIDLSMGKGRSLDYFFEIRDTVARTELI